MPKMKSHRGAAKRFSLTGKGKVKSNHTGRRHNLSSKTPARKADLRQTGYLKAPDEKRMKRILPK